VTGLATTFGSGAMTNSINEIEQAQVILVSGSNTSKTHPQVARRILNAVDNGAKLIVIDPRRTPMAERAHMHLALRPGSDIPLINAMMRIIIDENLIDDVFIEMRTENYLRLREKLYQLNLEELCTITGLPLEQIRAAAQLYARARKGVICYCLGVTQHICGTDNVQSYANLAMLTGQVEQQDTGVDPLRGQCNVQGACDMGALPGVFPGYQPVADPLVREKFEKAWRTKLPATAGLTLVDMTHGGPDGVVRGMYIMGENPMLSDPTLGKVRETLQGLEFLAVADLYLTETARIADVVLPAASFAEKEGTITSSERRVQLLRQAIPPIGSSRTDADIIISLANRLGYAMQYDSTAEIMEEIALLTPVYGGIFHDRLEATWGLQWPCPDRNHPGTLYLHKYSFTRGKGHFVPALYQPPSESVDEEYPLQLITGRNYHHYHTGTMSRKSQRLNRECTEAGLEIHPSDAEALTIRTGDLLRLSSRRGAIEIKAEVTDRVAVGNLFTTFHFAEAPVNALTVDARDPAAKCPEYKVCAVRVEKVQS
jgi:formate dehydrogenase major subunit/formate dehydrogenase alpha subunit